MTSAIDTSFITAAPVDKVPFKAALDTARDEITALMQVFGAINLFDNSSFRVNQRNYVSGTNVAAANTYTLDRWRVVTSGQNVSWTETAGVLTLTVPAGGFEQVIEGTSIAPGTYIINWTGTATATVGGTPATKGSVVTLTGGANVTVRFSNGTLSNPILQRRGAVGPATTVFPLQHTAIEIMRCQRYFVVLEPLTILRVFAGGAFGGGVTSFQFPVRMRAAPSAPHALFTRVLVLGTFDDPTLATTATGGDIWFNSGTIQGQFSSYRMQFTSDL